ncbi:hypothetical protein BDA96_09G263600 [Sorghum bicolor]|uniref:Uncharacterized protein n=1 Tax=Sorghum bicolor TaxID=4558 RepID=A0A921U603_SORBI|nr:hypothetical protein BDA96_09G263600 [Sorghum bicolor]
MVHRWLKSSLVVTMENMIAAEKGQALRFLSVPSQGHCRAFTDNKHPMPLVCRSCDSRFARPAIMASGGVHVTLAHRLSRLTEISVPKKRKLPSPLANRDQRSEEKEGPISTCHNPIARHRSA